MLIMPGSKKSKRHTVESTEECNSDFIMDVKQQIQQIRNTINTELSARLDQLDSSIEKRFTEIDKKIKVSTDVANEALSLAKSNSVNLTLLKSENEQLKRKINILENSSRRDNIVLHGIKQHRGETYLSCINTVKSFICDNLKISEDIVNKMYFVKCYRMSRFKHGDNPIVVRLLSSADRMLIFNSMNNLMGSKFSISQHYTSDVEYNRRKLYPVFKEAKKVLKDDNLKITLKEDKLTVGKNIYNVDTLESLPDNIHPRRLASRTSDNVLLFGGMYSEFTPLSNFYSKAFKFNGVSYVSAEQAFQHRKALFFDDTVTAGKILSARKPIEALRLGGKVADFDSTKWKSQRYNTMKDILRSKFSQNKELKTHLLCTKNFDLAEAGHNEYFAVGFKLIDKEATNKTSWKGQNKLGQILCEIRAEL